MPSRSHIILASSLLLLLTLPAIKADLMCYVCDDCAMLQKDTPLLACNEDFFNQGGSTEASTVTTTTTTEASTTTTEESTTVESTTTIDAQSTTVETSPPPQPTTTTTVETTTTELITESTASTEAPIPTPPTAGPVETTTGWPTPPAEDLLALAARNTTRLVAVETESTTPSLAIRQRRSMVDTDYTFHCYSVQAKVNGTTVTERGCSRVGTYEAVCDQLKQQNNGTELSNCDPCSMNACNGSSTLQASILGSLLLAIVAAALHRN
ncbi:LOW QUALITY PROTEIN: flocculation protein FLO11 [Drosophila obscura]|uniref:LOW QUALITY PROTEIN: flocculation protein FLO11 n=1 Tax=Drosophila obscura TaxID=7282 RepID=UPI001BB13004|nr:LOW QUALITY PROTEIN: flocculation protein FLO11 [Drosophila obscura]